jgi:hypothetical protein
MYAVVRHCKHSAPIGPCRFCLEGGNPETSQPKTVGRFDWEDIAVWGARNQNSRLAPYDGVAYSVVQL